MVRKNDRKYQYTLDQCDVQDKEKLKRFREKRTQWLDWLDNDEHHAILSAISSMVWNDVSFRTLAKAAELEPKGCLSNSLLAEILIDGHFAVQSLSIRRICDTTKGTISLVKLLDDIGRNIALFTRENFVSYDALPYDYEAAKQRVWAGRTGGGPFWTPRTGPDAWWVSEAAHREFDRLSATEPGNRTRMDCIPKAYIKTLRKWLEDSKSKEIMDWTHKFLAHAADRGSRNQIDVTTIQPSLDKITKVIRCFVRVSEAVHLLFFSGHGEVMPVAQFDQFSHLNAPLLANAQKSQIRALWDQLTNERNNFPRNVLDELLEPIAD